MIHGCSHRPGLIEHSGQTHHHVCVLLIKFMRERNALATDETTLIIMKVLARPGSESSMASMRALTTSKSSLDPGLLRVMPSNKPAHIGVHHVFGVHACAVGFQLSSNSANVLVSANLLIGSLLVFRRVGEGGNSVPDKTSHARSSLGVQ